MMLMLQSSPSFANSFETAGGFHPWFCQHQIEDPMERDAKIAQMQNFGKTPSRLESKHFPQRNIFVAVKEKSIDFSALYFLAPLAPPHCVVGA